MEFVLVLIEEWWIDEGNCICGLFFYFIGGVFIFSVVCICNFVYMVEIIFIVLWVCWNWWLVFLGVFNVVCFFGYNGGNFWNLCY